MSFATTKDKQSLIRSTFVRVTPGRCMDSLLTLSGGVYQCSWVRPVARVERNGVALTKDAAVPVSNDHWWFDEANQLFYVKLASAPDDTTNVVVLFYYLFACSGMAAVVSEDPLDASTTLRQWEPRISTEPDFKQSVTNVIAGVFSIDNTSLEFENADNFWNQFFTDYDSWNEKDVDAWIGLRASEADAYDFQRVYKGKAKQAVLNRKTVQVTVFDAFSRLNQPAFMGDAATECITSLVTYPTAYPQSLGKPIPYHAGRWSWYQTVSAGTTPVESLLDPKHMPEAFCSNWNGNASTIVNRAWVLGRCSADGLRSWSAPTPASNALSSGGIGTITWSSGNWATFAADIACGDHFNFVFGGLTYYAIVTAVDSANFRIAVAFDPAPGTLSGSLTAVNGMNDPSVAVMDSAGNYALLFANQVTTSVTTTSGGNKLVSITLANNFEAANCLKIKIDGTTGIGAASAFINPLDPRIHRVFYRLRLGTTNYTNHSDFLKLIATSAGLSTDATTFAAAKSALAVNVCVSVPNLDETSYRNYRDYAGDLLASTLGIMGLDSSGNAEYVLLAAPSSSDATDDNVAFQDSDSITVDYQDIVTELDAYNPHNASNAAVTASPSPSETKINHRAQYLHGVVNAVQFRHVLETITGRIDEILAVRSTRRATYLFNVATKYLDAMVGQDLLRKSSLLLGADTQRQVKIFSLDRSADQTAVGAVDLLGA